MSTFTIQLGQPDNTWQQYGLAQYEIIAPTTDRYKAISLNNQLVAIVGRSYQLLPNQEVVKVADQAAELAGLVPFNQFTGEWFARMDKHVIADKNGTRIHALYAANKSYTVNGEKMHIGVGVHNSIDGSSSFGAGIFTFRHACANMVLAGTRGYSQMWDQRQTIEAITRRHTKGISGLTENLREALMNLMDRATNIIRNYNLMAEQKATDELLEKLKKSRLPERVLPEYLHSKTEAQAPAALTTWQLYNDVTAAIWHNQKTGLRTKTHQFNTLHAVIQV